MKASWCKYRLDFKFTAITSREKMRHKDTYFIRVSHNGTTSSGIHNEAERNYGESRIFGLGEAGLFRGLSCDDRPEYEKKLSEVCGDIDRYTDSPELLADYPSIRFAVETATRDLSSGGKRIIFPSPWTEGKSSITINGLVWMGDAGEMRRRIKTKLDDECKCVKIKIGGINFDDELKLLEEIRLLAPDIELRLDANGAFSPTDAIDRLRLLSQFRIHSIEQPIRARQWDEMKRICNESPIPIALDEELIGLNRIEEKRQMLTSIKPQFIILKPTLCGGFGGSEEWIRLTKECGTGWWVTSALESNIGLNAIAQWTATLGSDMPQGLGTGLLYHNNIASPLTLLGDKLTYNAAMQWEIPDLKWICD